MFLVKNFYRKVCATDFFCIKIEDNEINYFIYSSEMVIVLVDIET